MGFWSLFKSTPKSLPQDNDWALRELVANYKEQVSSLKTELEQANGRILELRKRLELVPAMTVKPSATSVHSYTEVDLDTVPDFDEKADAKQIAAEDQRAVATLKAMEEELAAMYTELGMEAPQQQN